MAYVGTPIDTQNQFQSLQGKRFSGDASTTAFTLDIAPSSVFDIEVFVENVRQDPNSAYGISGTTLTFTGAPPSGTNNIYVVHQAKAVGTIDLPEGALVDLNGGSDRLVLDADGDTTISADTDDQIDLKAGGTDTMHIVNGKVGITSVPDLGVGLHIKTSDTGGSVNGNGDELVIENNGNAGLTILTGNSNTGSIFFADADDPNIGGIQYDHSTDDATMTFRAGDNVRMALKITNNDLTISQGNDYTNNGTGGGSGVSIKDIGGTRGEIGIEKTGTGAAGMIYFYNGNGGVGSITTSSSSTAYNTSSDYRLKENVDYTFDATSRLKQLKPARFNFKADADTTVDGFLAHEVSSIVPEAITGIHNEVQVWEEGEELPEGVSVGDNKLDDEGNTIPKYQGIDQSKLVPLLVKTIQELEARITALEG